MTDDDTKIAHSYKKMCTFLISAIFLKRIYPLLEYARMKLCHKACMHFLYILRHFFDIAIKMK